MEDFIKNGCDEDQLANRLQKERNEKQNKNTEKRLKNEEEYEKELQTEALRQKSKANIRKMNEVQMVREETRNKCDEYDKELLKEGGEFNKKEKEMTELSKKETLKQCDEWNATTQKKLAELNSKKDEIQENTFNNLNEINDIKAEQKLQTVKEAEEAILLESEFAQQKSALEEQRLDEIQKSRKEILETQIEKTKELKSKEMANFEKEQDNHKQLMTSKANAFHDHITVQHTRFQMNSVDSLNRHIEDVHRQKDEMKEAADICSGYLISGFTMTSKHRKRAQKYFDEFRVQTKNLISHLGMLDGKVADLGDDAKQTHYNGQIKEVKAKLSNLGTSTSQFIGMLLVSWHVFKNTMKNLY